MAENKPKSNLVPIVIVGLVLVVVAVVGYFMVSGSKPSPNANTAGNKTPQASQAKPGSSIPSTAPPGATPPNYLGGANAPVVLEEFADFQCPQCAAKASIMHDVQAAYGNKIKFIFRNFPLDIPSHDKNYDAAVAAEAAGFQGKFWDMQNLLFSNQNSWTLSQNFKSVLDDYGQKLGLNMEKFHSDMAGLQAKTRVDNDKARAKGIGINGTPSLFLNGQAVPFEKMTVEGLKPLIDAELAKSGGSSETAAPAEGNTAANTNATAAAPAANSAAANDSKSTGKK